MLALAFLFPSLNPVAFHVGPMTVHWYGLAYAVGILLGWQYVQFQIRRSPQGISQKDFSDYIPWAIFGIVAGGRLGIALFYHFSYYKNHLLEIFYIWRPGMSFHGGLIGVVVTTLIYCRRRQLPLWIFSDLLALAAPLGLFFGRCANFINSELWGRPTDVPWSVIFPQTNGLPRHPSQLYEAALEGLVLFILLHCLARYTSLRQDKPGALTGVFLSGYAIARITVEFFREPDAQIGYLWGGTTLGQWLCIPLLLVGLALLLRPSSSLASQPPQ